MKAAGTWVFSARLHDADTANVVRVSGGEILTTDGPFVEATTVGGAILFAFLAAWVFGREFADRTVRGLLANPTSRRTIVVAKATVVGIWGVAISACVLTLGLTVGAIVGLPGWSPADATATVAAIAVAALLTIGLQSGEPSSPASGGATSHPSPGPSR